MTSPDPTGKPKPSSANSAEFVGTDNPRHLRALAVMLRRPISRQELDSVAGCANGPALVSDLRDRGLTIPCERIHFTDRDGEVSVSTNGAAIEVRGHTGRRRSVAAQPR